jgi:hypothetical protein
MARRGGWGDGDEELVSERECGDAGEHPSILPDPPSPRRIALRLHFLGSLSPAPFSRSLRPAPVAMSYLHPATRYAKSLITRTILTAASIGCGTRLIWLVNKASYLTVLAQVSCGVGQTRRWREMS